MSKLVPIYILIFTPKHELTKCFIFRASTPVSDRSFKGATPGTQGGSGSRRNLDDELQSSSSRDDDRVISYFLLFLKLVRQDRFSRQVKDIGKVAAR